MSKGEREAIEMLDGAKYNANKKNKDRSWECLNIQALILDGAVRVGLREGSMWSRLTGS